jgi:hypothetical protein
VTGAGAVWLSTVGRPVAARAVPTWLGVAIVAGVVMGGNGLYPRDVIALASSSVRAVAVLAGAWLLLTAAAVRVGFGAPGAAYLRSLPGGPRWHGFAIVVCAALVHAPWALVWFAGGGAARGAAAWAGMTAASLVVVAGGAVLAVPAREPWWASPWRALVGAHVRALARRRVSALAAGAGMAALGGAFAALVIGHEAIDARGAAIISGACGALALAASLIAATAAVAEADRQVEWLAVAAAVPGGTRRLARAIVLGGLGAMAALVATGATAAVASLPAAQLGATAATNATLGLGLGLGAVEVSARARDGGRVVIGMLLLGITALVLIGLFSLLGVAAFLAIGLGLAAGGRRS